MGNEHKEVDITTTIGEPRQLDTICERCLTWDRWEFDIFVINLSGMYPVGLITVCGKCDVNEAL